MLAKTQFCKAGSWISGSRLNTKGFSILGKIGDSYTWICTADCMTMFICIKTCKINKMEMILQKTSR